MKILMLSPVLPWPLNIGSKMRVFYVLRELSRAWHEVTLVANSHEPYNEVDLYILRQCCAELHVIAAQNRSREKTALRSLFYNMPYGVAKFESKRFKQVIAQALREHYDIIWVHFTETLAYIPEEFEQEKKTLIVLDQHNADERFWRTYASQGPPWIRFFAIQNLIKLRRFQTRLLQRVDVILSV